MSGSTGPRTSIAVAELRRIEVRGRDLCDDLLGRVAFTDYFLLLLTGEMPDERLRRVTEATLVAIAEHGLVPSVVAARMTLAAAPDALQGAVAAGLLGCGSVILGAAETAGDMLAEVLAQEAEAGSLDEAARRVLTPIRAARRALPGFGHPIHREGDPRAAKLLSLAEEWGTAGAHCAALRAVGAQVEGIWGRPLVLNVSGAIPAVLLDAGYPRRALRGIPILARAASLIAHLLEESQRPTGFAMADAAAAAVPYNGPRP
ncbi:citryl-CoA lyase [Muricoccus pecuniae]|uniref:citrate synthase (unknown stereospecificity) n=1 Tax=Muricoccus pecuniae TaxID=693023 RepID=A0A840YNA4_9PROT|nr:citryl-CoA lyase [Roseomonas pecuniae]MBB5696394.1 citrate synthase [Roseomonas pecuniae]